MSPGRPKKVTLEILKKVNDFLEQPENWYQAANRCVKKKVFDATSPTFRTVKAVETPVRYLEDSLDFLFFKYKESGGTLKETIFRKTLKTYFPFYKKARKETDLCSTCEMGKQIKICLDKYLDRYCTCKKETCTCELDTEVAQKIVGLKSALAVVNTHKQLKKARREEFNQNKASIKKGEFLLVMDFKKNFTLKEKQRQEGKDYYNKPQRTCFGAIVFYYDEATNCIREHPYDIFSVCLTHDATFVRHALDTIFKDQWFKEQQFSKGYFWMDGGPHFKNYEMAHYFWQVAVKDLFKQGTEWNFFVENHGKNPCDSRFSTLSTWVSNWTSQSKNELVSEKDLVKAVQEGQFRSNSVRPKKELPIFSTQLIIEITPSEEVLQTKFRGIQSYYHFVCTKKVFFIV